ncbi:MAG: CBS domain-containing protein [Flavobacteriales bacterium]|nr:CBS domain-containing protein [Flavobacteriales bacterium]
MTKHRHMGDQQISHLTGKDKKEFLRYLLDDIAALEHMEKEGMIEAGITRIGAEQEFCLVGADYRPSLNGPEILGSIKDKHYTAELAKWNLEINLDPQPFKGKCFSAMHTQLKELLELGKEQALKSDDKIILTGILPTIRKSELDFDNMTPNPRYRVLDQTMKEQRGEDFNLYIEGVDELSLKHDSILFEACNTSFQIHLQISPEEFVDRYNWAQVISGPVLAGCVNSPILLGKELWSETRIALFRQSIDVRNTGNYIRERQPRVAFGHKWLEHNAAEIFKEDISQYNLIVSGQIEESALDVLDRGEIPELRAMNLHNGTIYKWNRACYGIGGGKPHLRIENRYVPSGPTTIDEMAATVFWTGLMMAMPDNCRGTWHRRMFFQDVRSNFLKAARNGLGNEFRWFGRSVDGPRLINDVLLPMAEESLYDHGIEEEDYLPYLKVIEARVAKKQTGSDWIINSLRHARREGASVNEALLLVTQSMHKQADEGAPVHEWSVPEYKELVHIPGKYQRVDSIMSTDMITVREDDLMSLAERLLDWNDHDTLPVENLRGQVIGLICLDDIKEMKDSVNDPTWSLVKDWMQRDITTVGPESSIDHAKKALVLNKSLCLPVVKDSRLVGVLTKSDIRILEEKG